MRLSLSVNLSDILTEKKSILENLFSWGSFFGNGLRPAKVFSLLERLEKRLNSEEEQELIRWSVELGRKAKRESFKRLLSELPPKRREEVLDAMSPEKRKEYK